MADDGNGNKQIKREFVSGEVRAKPARRHFSPPVAWLLGPELIGALKRLVLFAMYGGEFDMRDWMHANRLAPIERPDDGELWFDYVADIGDGQAAMYTTAFLLQDDLLVEGSLDTAAAARAAAAATPTALTHRGVLAPGALAAPEGWSRLPRGELLLVGGDTAYPIADDTNLGAHVREPVTWAYRDLQDAGRPVDAGEPRPIYGIPGNHDYYDQLVGFNRMFLRPCTPEGGPGARGRSPMLGLPGFVRAQTASYFSLQLPWGWQIWGLDLAKDDDLDYRQEVFFRERAAERAPDRLLLVLPSPPVVFGRVVATAPVIEQLDRLGLPSPFLAWDGRGDLLDGSDKPGVPTVMAPDTCRLDLAGDIHHYARYDGGAAAPAGAPAASTPYAAVVSGAGGAFHHPSCTDYREVPARRRYPAPETSRRAMAASLFRWATVPMGGMVVVAAAVLGLLIGSASIQLETRALLDTGWSAVGLVPVPTAMSWQADFHTPSWGLLAGAAALLGSLLASGLLILISIQYSRWVTRTIRMPAGHSRRLLAVLHSLGVFAYMPAWVLLAAAVYLPTWLPAALVDLPSATALLFQVGFLAAVLALPVVLVLVAWKIGATYRRRPEKPAFIALGVIHSIIQLTLPVLLVRVGSASWPGLALAFAAIAVAWWASPKLLASDSPKARKAVLALWIGHWLAVVAILLVLAHGHAFLEPSSNAEVALLLIASAVVGALAGSLEFGWYLAVALAWNGHNNEAGAAARIQGFRQFIRFRLDRRGLTGFVIGVDEVGVEGKKLEPRVVDVFTIAPAAGP